ncbi:CHAT domain-containing protein [Echinicola vietnamensis]|nr:CHAT domain-containing tetratricopeptide repeat protein [Echinicola vietnamensis]
MLLLCVPIYGEAWAQETDESQYNEITLSDTSNTVDSYKSEILDRIDSLRSYYTKEHPQYDSLLFSIYDGYKQQYVDLEYQNDTKKALQIALACEAIFIGELEDKEQADLIYNIAHIYDKDEQYLKALNYYRRSIERYEAIHDVERLDLRNDLALAYNNIGVIHAHTGFFTKRKECYLKAKALWESMDEVDKSNLISLYGNLLGLYAKYGDREASEELITMINDKFDQWMAEDSFGKGRKELQAEHPPQIYQVQKHRLNLQYLGFTNDRTSGLAHWDSLSTYFHSMSLKDQQRYSEYLLNGVYRVATLMVDQDNVSERAEERKFIDLGMKESNKLGDRYYEMIFHTRLVTFYEYATEDFANALIHLDSALQIGKEMDIREFNLLNIYLKRGDMLQKLGRFEEAEEMAYHGFSLLLEEPVSDLFTIQREDFAQRNDIYYVDALREVAKIYKNQFRKGGNTAHAQLAYHFYTIAADLFHVYYQKGVYNPWLDMTNKDITEGVLSMHLALGITDHDKLVNTLERNMSQHLWKEFEAKYQQFLSVPDSLLIKHNMLKASLARAKNDTIVLAEELERLDRELLANEAAISSYDKKYFSFFSGQLDINELRTRLSGEQAIIRYIATDKKLFAIVVNSSNVSVVEIGEKKPVFELVESYHDQVQSIRDQAVGLSRELYDRLIRPLGLNEQTIRHLVIVPQSNLNLLAFESLENSKTGRLMVEDYELSYAYSLKLWELQQNAGAYSSHKNSIAAFVPEYPKSYLAAMEEDHVTRGRLTYLEGALSEAQYIVDKLGGDVFHKDAANKNRFIASIGHYQIYHFATHAMVDHTNYEKSGIYFQDGETLSYSELYQMRFPAEMVVLSACNTGIGELHEGEGLMSLSRALTYAGVRTSVYSLWQVPDEETSILMKSFYKYLVEGYGKEEALAMAKRTFLDDFPMKRHPFYWAGFVLNGNLEALSLEDRSGKFWKWGGYLIILLLLLGVIVYTYRKKKGTRTGN